MEKGDRELIEKAKGVVMKARKARLIDTGCVGAALITDKGNIYTGASTGFYCGIGACAEHYAVGNMIANGEKAIKTIVAVFYDERAKKFKIIPPCGKCREMIKQTSKRNMRTRVIVSERVVKTIRELLPYSWDGTIEQINKD